MKDSYEAKSQWLQKRLLSYDDSLKKRVEQTFRNFNNTIRGHIRTETALRLGASVEEGSASVPVKIVDGFPHLFEILIQELDPQFWDLFLKRSLLKATSKGMEFLDKNFSELNYLLQPQGNLVFDFAPNNICSIKKFIDDIVQVVDEKGILRRLRSLEDFIKIDSEVLGAYFFKTPEIHLYWAAIALIAIELEVSVEALTMVTLTHELVHAYTHIGQDTDNDKWDTDAFARTHPNIVEGLAQFYTEVICRKLETRQPDVLDAFLKLLNYQSEPYTRYCNWTYEESGRAEIIRSAMIECRKNCIVEIDHFEYIVDKTRDRIGKR